MTFLINPKKKDKTEIVWIYGSSGAGKETFIKFLCERHSTTLLSTLSWNDKVLIPCVESIDWVAQYYKDPLGSNRKNLVDIVVNLAKNQSAVVLVKGQDLDLKYNRPQILKKKLPDCSHKIIFLHTNVTELLRRWKSKKWWENTYTEKTVREWLLPQIDRIDELKDDFEIIALDSSSLSKYPRTSFPPKL